MAVEHQKVVMTVPLTSDFDNMLTVGSLIWWFDCLTVVENESAGFSCMRDFNLEFLDGLLLSTGNGAKLISRYWHPPHDAVTLGFSVDHPRQVAMTVCSFIKSSIQAPSSQFLKSRMLHRTW